MGTAIHRALAQTEIWRFAETYGIPGEPVDGMDVLAVRECVGRAVERARRDKSAHAHRGRAPTGSAATRCGIPPEPCTARGRRSTGRSSAIRSCSSRERCKREGVLTETDAQSLEKAANDQIDEAVAFAEASPEPPAEWLLTDVYKEGQ